MIKDYDFLYLIEVEKGSTYGSRKDPKTGRLVLKRVSSTWFPTYYGCVEEIKKETEVTNSVASNQVLEEEDFYLITDKKLFPGLGIPDYNIVRLGKFICYDERKKEYDSKLVVGLKSEVETYPDNRLIQEFDSIRAFLIVLRAKFKITGFIPEEGLNSRPNLKSLFEKVDWEVQSLWPHGCDSLEKGYMYND